MPSQLKTFFFFLTLVIFVSCDENSDFENDIIIAHAGGAIDGYIYTNSLEALDYAYAKGCRLFELDLMLTSDGKIVAVHSWEDFRQFTGYEEISNTPLTEAEFLSQKIHGKYTPMNMERINDWFTNHEDAILVTDKINDPKFFCEYFPYKNRLIMELFSWDAIETALEEGVKPMISEYFSGSIPDEEKKIIDMKIKYLAVSLEFVDNNPELLKRLKKKRIKAYVFGLSKEKDERYIYENKMDYVYGMYADNMEIVLNVNNNQ